MNQEERVALKGRIERVLSEILSDKYDCDITLKFVPKERTASNHETICVFKEVQKDEFPTDKAG